MKDEGRLGKRPRHEHPDVHDTARGRTSLAHDVRATFRCLVDALVRRSSVWDEIAAEVAA
jgi:hypothetical protein